MLLLCWTNSQFNNETSNKKNYIAVVMEEIKALVFVFYYSDKIEPEEVD